MKRTNWIFKGSLKKNGYFCGHFSVEWYIIELDDKLLGIDHHFSMRNWSLRCKRPMMNDRFSVKTTSEKVNFGSTIVFFWTKNLPPTARLQIGQLLSFYFATFNNYDFQYFENLFKIYRSTFSYNKCSQSIVFNCGQKMALKAFYFITMYLWTYCYTKRSQRYLLGARENNWLDNPICYINRFL